MTQSVFDQHDILDKLYIELRSSFLKGEIATYDQLLKIAPNLTSLEYEEVINRFKSHIRQQNVMKAKSADNAMDQAPSNTLIDSSSYAINDSLSSQLTALQQEFSKKIGYIVNSHEKMLAHASQGVIEEITSSKIVLEKELEMLKANYAYEHQALVQELDALKIKYSALKEEHERTQKQCLLMRREYEALSLLKLLITDHGIETVEALPFHPSLNTFILELISQAKALTKEQMSSLASLLDYVSKISDRANEMGLELSKLSAQKYEQILKEKNSIALSEPQTHDKSALSEQEQAFMALKDKFKHIEQLGADNSYFMEDDSFDRHDESTKEGLAPSGSDDIASQFKSMLEQSSVNGGIDPKLMSMVHDQVNSLSAMQASSSAQAAKSAPINTQSSDDSALSSGALLGNAMAGSALSGSPMSGNALSGNAVSVSSMAGSSLAGSAMPGSAVAGNGVAGGASGSGFGSANKVSHERVIEVLNVIAHDLLAKKAAHELTYQDLGQAIQTAMRMDVCSKDQLELISRLLIKIMFIGSKELKLSDFAMSEEDLLALIDSEERRAFARGALSWLKNNINEKAPYQNPLSSLVSGAALKGKDAYNTDYQKKDLDSLLGTVEIINSSEPKAIPRDEGTLVREMSQEGGDDNIAAFAAASAKIASLAPLLHEAGKELKQAQKELDADLEKNKLKDRLSSHNEDSKITASSEDDGPLATIEITSVAKDVVKVASELEQSNEDRSQKKLSLFDNSQASEHTGTTVFGVDKTMPSANKTYDHQKEHFISQKDIEESDDESLDDFITGNITNCGQELDHDPQDSFHSDLGHEAPSSALPQVTGDELLASDDQNQTIASIESQLASIENVASKNSIFDDVSLPSPEPKKVSVFDQPHETSEQANEDKSVAKAPRYVSTATVSATGKTAIIKTTNIEDQPISAKPQAKEPNKLEASLEASNVAKSYAKGTDSTVIIVKNAKEQANDEEGNPSIAVSTQASLPNTDAVPPIKDPKAQDQSTAMQPSPAQAQGQASGSTQGQAPSQALGSAMGFAQGPALSSAQSNAQGSSASLATGSAQEPKQELNLAQASSFNEDKLETKVNLQVEPTDTKEPIAKPMVSDYGAQSVSLKDTNEQVDDKQELEPKQEQAKPQDGNKLEAQACLPFTVNELAKVQAQDKSVPNASEQGSGDSKEKAVLNEPLSHELNAKESGFNELSAQDKVTKDDLKELSSKEPSLDKDDDSNQGFELKTKLTEDDLRRFEHLCGVIDQRINERISKVNLLLHGNDAPSSNVQVKDVLWFYKSCINSLETQGMLNEDLKKALHEKMEYDLKTNKLHDIKSSNDTANQALSSHDKESTLSKDVADKVTYPKITTMVMPDLSKITGKPTIDWDEFNKTRQLNTDGKNPFEDEPNVVLNEPKLASQEDSREESDEDTSNVVQFTPAVKPKPPTDLMDPLLNDPNITNMEFDEDPVHLEKMREKRQNILDTILEKLITNEYVKPRSFVVLDESNDDSSSEDDSQSKEEPPVVHRHVTFATLNEDDLDSDQDTAQDPLDNEQEAPANEQISPADKPDIGAGEQEAQVSEPNSPADKPNAQVSEQEASTNEQMVPANEPISSVDKLDIGAGEQEAQVSEPNSSADKPNAQVSEQEASTNEPMVPANEPMSLADKLENGAGEQEVKVSEPNSSADKPNTQVSEQEASTNEQMVPANEPMSSVDKLEDGAGEQEAKVSEPNSPADKPNAQVSEQEASINEQMVPANEPMNSSDKLEYGAGEQEVLASEPNSSADKPNTQVSEQEAPANEQMVPANEPMSLADKPNTQVSEQETPANEPMVPANEPISSTDKLEGGVGEQEVVASEPNGSADKPNTQVSEQEALVNEQMVPANEPISSADKLEDGAGEQEAQISEPVGSTDQPNAQVSEQEVGASEPDGKEDELEIDDPDDEDFLEITPANQYVSAERKVDELNIPRNFSAYQGFGMNIGASYSQPKEATFMFQDANGSKEQLKTEDSDSKK